VWVIGQRSSSILIIKKFEKIKIFLFFLYLEINHIPHSCQSERFPYGGIALLDNLMTYYHTLTIGMNCAIATPVCFIFTKIPTAGAHVKPRVLSTAGIPGDTTKVGIRKTIISGVHDLKA
jgi:hypothetical protein